MPASEDGSVNQRFCIAILQKVSIKIETVPIFVDLEVIPFTINLIQRLLKLEQLADRSGAIFCLDFVSALLANLVHAPST